MEYRMKKYLRKYFERYCNTYLKLDTPAVSRKATVLFDRFMKMAPDMGKKGNMMASNLDMVAAFFAYYEASNHQVGGEAIDTMVNWLAEDYGWIGFFTDMNKRKYVRPLYYKIYSGHAKKVREHKAKGEWTGTWNIRINPDHRKEGIYYHMSGCPLYAFARTCGYSELMPYICRFDFIFEKFLHARLIRTQTEATGGDYCDYWFLPDQSKTAEKYKDFQSV